jgi:hypothetical protein
MAAPRAAPDTAGRPSKAAARTTSTKALEAASKLPRVAITAAKGFKAQNQTHL